MIYQLPHTIKNPGGEQLTFLESVQEVNGEKLLVENYVQPGSVVPMHTHFLQDEGLTIIRGRMGYQVKGQAPQFAGPGDTIVFKRGTPHSFWNAGNDVLHCKGFITPANTIIFFLSSIYAAQNKTNSAKPEMFDAAYLLTRYSSEYDMNAIPWLVKKTIMPLTYFIGKMLGKYKHFENAPQPVKG